MGNLSLILQKIITLAFAFLVFVIVLLLSDKYRPVLTHVGILLMMTIVYLEMLMIRDHLWLIEGSLIETKKWRDAFFSKQSVRQQRLRKFLTIVLATIIFTFVFIHTKSENELISFLGTVLMVTVLYFEALTIRDEVYSLSSGLKAREIAEMAKKEAMAQTGEPSAAESENRLDHQEDE